MGLFGALGWILGVPTKEDRELSRQRRQIEEEKKAQGMRFWDNNARMTYAMWNQIIDEYNLPKEFHIDSTRNFGWEFSLNFPKNFLYEKTEDVLIIFEEFARKFIETNIDLFVPIIGYREELTYADTFSGLYTGSHNIEGKPIEWIEPFPKVTQAEVDERIKNMVQAKKRQEQQEIIAQARAKSQSLNTTNNPSFLNLDNNSNSENDIQKLDKNIELLSLQKEVQNIKIENEQKNNIPFEGFNPKSIFDKTK